mgnify:CR=1 FL=1
MGASYGLIVSLVCVGLHFVLGLATFYGPLSVIFDYLLPMAIVGIVGLIPLIKINQIEIPIGIIIVMLMITQERTKENIVIEGDIDDDF